MSTLKSWAWTKGLECSANASLDHSILITRNRVGFLFFPKADHFQSFCRLSKTFCVILQPFTEFRAPHAWEEHTQPFPTLPAVPGSLCMILPENLLETSQLPLLPLNSHGCHFPCVNTVHTHSLQEFKQSQKQLQTKTQPTNVLLLPWRTIR